MSDLYQKFEINIIPGRELRPFEELSIEEVIRRYGMEEDMGSDTFRKAYRELGPQELKQIDEIKVAAEKLLAAYELPVSNLIGRERSLAITKLEESVMWAVKGISGSWRPD